MIEFYEEKNGFANYQQGWPQKGDKVYRFADLHTPKMEAVIIKAKKMYRDACDKYIKKHGDRGSCILGNGIYIYVKPPKARRVFRMELITPVGQSDSASYACKDPVIAYLKENDIDSWYEHGRMD